MVCGVYWRKLTRVGFLQGADASVEGLRTLGAAFPIPAGVVAEAPRAITSEEKSAGSQYAALRTARANQRYAGIRAERQKKKDEEEAAKYVSSYFSG